VIVEIIEVLRRSAQGMTQPFICRGDNGKVYFVKGKGAGKRSLICEWISGHIALELGIPIAPFCMVSIPKELLDSNHLLDLTDLGYNWIQSIPETWWFLDEELTVSAKIDKEQIFKLLNRVNENEFWRLP
jgi:hypothetical protein